MRSASLWLPVVALLVLATISLAHGDPDHAPVAPHRATRLMRDARGQASRAALLVEPDGRVERASPAVLTGESEEAGKAEAVGAGTGGALAADVPRGISDSDNIHGLRVSDVAMTDNVHSLKLGKSVLVNETELFVKHQIAWERSRRCPSRGAIVPFTVVWAASQITENILVLVTLRLANGEIVKNVKVEWTAEPQDESAEALKQMDSELQAKHLFSEKLAKYAKLIMPKDACDLGTTGAPSTAGPVKPVPGPLPESLQLSSVDTPVVELVNPNLDSPEYQKLLLSPPMGVVIEMEAAAYKRGQSAAKRATKRTAGADIPASALPASFSWLKHSPHCLDYVHHQKDCGSCYMFAALDSLSDRHCINRGSSSSLGSDDHLSIQMALMCEPLGRQCSGGWADVGFNYTMLQGVDTEANWQYERSCLSDSVCQFGSQCITPSMHECSNFFSAAELDRIQTYADASREAQAKCGSPGVKRVDDCRAWATRTFGVQIDELFSPSKSWCSKAALDFKQFLLPPMVRSVVAPPVVVPVPVPTPAGSPPLPPAPMPIPDTPIMAPVPVPGAAPAMVPCMPINTSAAPQPGAPSAALPTPAVSPPPSPAPAPTPQPSVAGPQPSANRSNGSGASLAMGNCSCHCLFETDSPGEVGTFADALALALTKCDGLPHGPACRRWAEQALGALPTAVFSPSEEFCDRLWSDFTSFLPSDGPRGEPRLSVPVEDPVSLAADAAEAGGLSAGVLSSRQGWWWGRRRRTEASTGDSRRRSSASTTRTTKTTTTTTTQQTVAMGCNRDRCNTVPKTHSLTNYHYIVQRTSDEFKLELYNGGPFYTSFYVYEDFTWFFGQFPTLAYNKQWGQQMGGHAVVLIGWEASCVYHDGTEQTEGGGNVQAALVEAERGADSQGENTGAKHLADRARRHRQHSGASRRRSATGACWHLRNTWGDRWADNGYFRMYQEMLTGPPGVHIHIASAAGDGVKSST